MADDVEVSFCLIIGSKLYKTVTIIETKNKKKIVTNMSKIVEMI